MNRFKGLDMVNREPEELWTEICDIILKAVTKIITKKNICKKSKWFYKEALQIVEEKGAVKSKGKKGKLKLYPTECNIPENSKER